MIVRIEPIKIKKWHGKSGIEDPTSKKWLHALVNNETLEYDTGLSYEGKYEHPKNTGGLTEAAYYGKILKQDLSNTYIMGEAHSFWDSTMGRVVLENKPMFFNTDIPIQHIRYKICLASRLVANSMEEYEKGLFPKATHVIVNKNLDIERRAKKISLEIKAIQGLSDLSLERKRQILTFIDGIPHSELSEKEIDIKLFEAAEQKSEQIIDALSIPKEDMGLFSLAYTAISYGILKRIPLKGITYKDEFVGSNVEGVVTYFKENQDFQLRIMGELKDKL